MPAGPPSAPAGRERPTAPASRRRRRAPAIGSRSTRPAHSSNGAPSSSTPRWKSSSSVLGLRAATRCRAGVDGATTIAVEARARVAGSWSRGSNGAGASPASSSRQPRPSRAQPGRSRAPRQGGEQGIRPEVLVDVDAAHGDSHIYTTNPIDFQEFVRSTITEVALTAAVAGTPGASPSSSTASRVTAATTQVRARLDLHERHHAVDLDRAHDARRSGCGRSERRAGLVAAAACRRAARPPPRGTSRRLRASRVVRSLPARSQRRSVSALTPSARAASPSVRSATGGSAPSTRCGALGRELDLPDRRLGLHAVDQRARAVERLAAVRRADAATITDGSLSGTRPTRWTSATAHSPCRSASSAPIASSFARAIST